ncbi:virion core protein, T7 gp14 family [Acinetobacter soli]|uniref:virion core protein, T7 gp14 family n=1 Tax=Acinetobacter soli TaxID=487316 RepID=UPI001F369180|nr:hypothetical protein [Acinetobacter soli]MCE6007449.1 hypothetical protein [Acinetobacter soli]
MFWIPLAIAAAQGISEYNKSKGQKKALKQQAVIAEQNALNADIQARNSIETGRSQLEDYQRNVANFKSSQINALAENGIDVSQGSAIDILAGTEMTAQKDTDTLRYNAALESWGHKVEATNFRNQANGYTAQAKAINPVRNGIVAGVTSYFSGGMGGMGGLGSSASSAASSSAGLMNQSNGFKSWFGAEGASLAGSNPTTAWKSYQWNSLLAQ